MQKVNFFLLLVWYLIRQSHHVITNRLFLQRVIYYIFEIFHEKRKEKKNNLKISLYSEN